MTKLVTTQGHEIQVIEPTPETPADVATKQYVDDNAGGGAGGGTWGSITGTLSDQTDLQAALDAKGTSSFSGSYDDLTNRPTLFSGAYADLTGKPTLGTSASKDVGTVAGTVAAGDHTHASSSGEAFPVGSVFIAVVSTDPATLLGYGTWSAFAAGRMLVGVSAADSDFDTVEATGGAKTSSAVVNHTHGVTITDPGHAHVQGVNSATTGGLSGYTPDTSTNTRVNSGYSTSTATTGITASTADPSGGVSSFSLMNPYITVYMWKRTA